jgi:hypothetical protein
MLLALLAPKDLFPVCCWLCLLPKTYSQYAVYFACSQRLISSRASKVNSILEISLWEQAKPTAYWKQVFGSKQSKQHTGIKSLGASKVNSILEISLLLALLALKDLFPVCCWLCLLPETYFQYAVYFACSQKRISSMLLALLALKDLFPVTAYWK